MTKCAKPKINDDNNTDLIIQFFVRLHRLNMVFKMIPLQSNSSNTPTRIITDVKANNLPKAGNDRVDLSTLIYEVIKRKAPPTRKNQPKQIPLSIPFLLTPMLFVMFSKNIMAITKIIGTIYERT